MGISGKVVTSLAVAALAMVAASPNYAEAAKLSGRNVKIGCMVPLTGKGAEWGQTGKRSMESAVE